MMKHALAGLFITVLLSYPVSQAEASMNKCTDGRQTTYTNEPCEKLGLNSAGPIKYMVTIVPVAAKPQAGAPAKPENSRESSNDVSLNKGPDDKAPVIGEPNIGTSGIATTKPANPPSDSASKE